MGKIRIGTSGWAYDDWKGPFYPEDLPQRRRLEFLADRFDTVEINKTFYSLTRPETCRDWYRTAPGGFRFAVKGSRFITHMKRLRDVDAALANFFASGILELNDKMGPILWQLPADLRFDADRIDTFLGMLPGDTQEATKLAHRHDDRVPRGSYGDGERHRIRHVLEFRHDSFLQPEMARIAKRHGTAVCFSHARDWPYVEEVTAGFVYLRLHGPGAVYSSSYSDELEHWARRLIAWHSADQPGDAVRISDLAAPKRKERDVYVYFDNDVGARAPKDAARLARLVSENSR